MAKGHFYYIATYVRVDVAVTSHVRPIPYSIPPPSRLSRQFSLPLEKPFSVRMRNRGRYVGGGADVAGLILSLITPWFRSGMEGSGVDRFDSGPRGVD